MEIEGWNHGFLYGSTHPPHQKKVPADVLMVLVGETCGFRSGGSV
jgi:hypothetical protein